MTKVRSRRAVALKKKTTGKQWFFESQNENFICRSPVPMAPMAPMEDKALTSIN